jgi:hypothetical protein
VLNLFEQTNRQEVPSYVHKLSVFNKPYFTGVFIPRLIHLKDTDEAKYCLVEKLKDAKKIPK